MTFSRPLLLAAALFMPAPARAEDPGSLIDPAQMTAYWWAFLVSGENKTPLAPETAQQMQQGHIANLERLGKEGKAVAAGPFGDRTPLRGIVVLTVKSRAEAEAEFKDDPFVKAGYLKPEIHQWVTFKNSFGKAVEPFMLGQYRFVLYKRGPQHSDADTPEARAAQEAHLKHLLAARKEGLLALVGPLRDAGDRRGILVFRTAEEARARAVVDADPHVKSGRLVAEHHPLYLGKGVIDPPRK